MTQEQFDAEAARYEPPRKVQGKPLTDAQWSTMKQTASTIRRRRGRPVKPIEDHVARVLVSMPRDLLAAIDAAATSEDVSRAAIIAKGMRLLLNQ